VAVASDLEGTLTVGETWRGIGRHVMTHLNRWGYRWFFARRFPEALAARAGRIDKRAFQDRWMRDLLRFYRGVPEPEFAAAAAWVVEHELWPKRRDDVLAALRVHLAGGDRVVLTSGTYQQVLDAFAERVARETGRPVDAIGTLVEMEGGTLTGRVAGDVNVGAVKAARLREALGSEPLSAAYGDTVADLPMLRLSDHPVAVYPDEGLRRAAVEQGWSVLDG
jgi:HAD superfamily phosphoserine phosphatase-like hydrolase